jgi:hypothetical protein
MPETKHVRLRATVVLEYDAHPDNYGTDDPAKMAQIDASNFNDDRDFFWQLVDDDGTIKVEPVA